jgi:hypothetical protein
MSLRQSIVLALVAALLLCAGPTVAQDDPLRAGAKTVNVELILDASGSMAELLPSGESRMAAAQRILRQVITELPEREGVNVGLRVYGHEGDNTLAGKAVSCRSSELLVPVSGVDKDLLLRQLGAIQPTGWTPIAYSLAQAAADFQPGGESITNAVVLVTDGEETCDPPAQSCTAAGALQQADVRVTTHVVGFALTPEQTEQVGCIAEQGGGQLFGADDAAGLGTAIGSALEEVGAAPPPGSGAGLNSAAAGPWEFTVTGVERQESLEVPGGTSAPINPKGVFLLVRLRIVNTGTEDQTYDPTWFRVTDDRGRGWSFDFTATDTLALAGAGERQYHTVPPGLPTEAVVVFDVPPDATGLTLGVAEDLGATSEPRPSTFSIPLGA